MQTNALREMVAMAARLGHVLVATADSEGRPHLAAAGELGVAPDARLAVSAWFCPGTVANLESNPHISVVAWDAGRDIGFQLVGDVEAVEDVAVIDGGPTEAERLHPVPQVERRAVVRVRRAMRFTLAPHTDTDM